MIAKMKKLTLATLKSDADSILKELLYLESVESVNFDESLLPEGTFIFDNAKNVKDTENSLQKITQAIDVLSKFGAGKKKKKSYSELTRKEFEAFSEKENAAKTISDSVADTLKEQSSIRARINKCESDISSLNPFISLDESCSFEGTKNTLFVKGTFPKLSKIESVKENLCNKGFDFELSVLCEKGDYIYVCALVHKNDADEFLKAINAEGFSRIILQGFVDTPKNETAKLKEEIKSLEDSLSQIDKKLKEEATNLPLLYEAYDFLSALLAKEQFKEKLCETSLSCILTGFVPDMMVTDLEKVLDRYDCCYSLTEPDENDKVPVKLKNNKFSTPFESVLGLYSYPDYRGIDPTFVMSIFYFIIFGLIMQDVIYGLLLFAGCRVMLKVLHAKKGGGMYNLLSMFSICGISTMVFGFLFGGYFGDLPSAFAINMLGMESFPDIAVLLNPVTNPMPYLVISLAMGVLHLVAGMLMKAYMLIKRGHILDAIFDIGFWLVTFTGVGLLFVVPDIGKYVAIAGVAGIILTAGREAKNPIMKLVKGVMALYDSVSYISDLLSYSRIMALGLSGAIIAQVVNIIGTLGGPTVMGFIVFVLAMALGHALNLALSVLGAFVHTARLQYIEFFNKFYEDGGEPFKPERINTKYHAVVKETVKK